MNVRHLSYLITVIDCDLNLSAAAKKIHISQPALSQIIRNFEEEIHVQLFHRQNGRLKRITHIGETFFASARKIVGDYNEMMETIRKESSQSNGKINIGIPPLVITVNFADFISNVMVINREIKMEITEAGAEVLRKDFLSHKMDIAILLQPTRLNSASIEELILERVELTAFMRKDHALAMEDKLNWCQLDLQSLAIFNETFMIHHLLKEKFRQEKVRPEIEVTSASWDFLLNTALSSNIITILPSSTTVIFPNKEYVEVPFENPLFMEVTFCRHKKKYYTDAEEYAKKLIVNYFKMVMHQTIKKG
ncbi:LysR family transcriptional regulator [Bacillaceae bacterium Marseille-Q3522]|nr:LysR family transcriptional regulator [Bacillaceae bacterium Marseille-Q3522]